MSLYYEDEYVELHLGDCRAIRGWTRADVLVTDPPYGIRWSGVANYTRGIRSDRRTLGNENPIANDGDLEARDAVLELWGPRRPAIVFGTWSMPRPGGVRHRLVWWKRGQAPGPANAAFMTQDEEIYVLGDGFVKSAPPMRSVIASDEARSVEVQKVGHPTPKPVSLMEALIGRCPPEWVIADPFAGSGSTLVAARNLGRKAIGVEVEERYCELIARRLSQQAFDFSALDGGGAA